MLIGLTQRFVEWNDAMASEQRPPCVRGKRSAVAVVNDSVSGLSEPPPGLPQLSCRANSTTGGLCGEMLRIRVRLGEKVRLYCDSPSVSFADSSPYTSGASGAPAPVQPTKKSLDFAQLARLLSKADKHIIFFLAFMQKRGYNEPVQKSKGVSQ